MKHKTQQEWLKDVDIDQNVNGLATLTQTLKNALNKRWFASQVVQPVVYIGTYNHATGKYELNSNYQSAILILTDVAVHTLTCPDGFRYKVTFVTSAEGGFATRNFTMSAQLSGITIMMLAASGVMAVGVPQVLIGSPFCINNAGTFNPAIPNPIVMNPGDSLSVTQAGWIVGDGHSTAFVYEVEVI
jgi:hypothetical protein